MDAGVPAQEELGCIYLWGNSRLGTPPNTDDLLEIVLQHKITIGVQEGEHGEKVSDYFSHEITSAIALDIDLLNEMLDMAGLPLQVLAVDQL